MTTSQSELHQLLSLETNVASLKSACPGCHAVRTYPFFQLGSVPLNCSALWPDKSDAQNCRRGEIELTFCPACELVFNSQYNPDLLDYSDNYENSLDFSPLFRAYSQNLSERLVETYDLRKKHVVGLGSGRGEFLKLTLGDRSGSLPAMIWDGVAEARELCRPGEIVFVNGRFAPEFSLLGAMPAGVWLASVRRTQSERPQLLDAAIDENDTRGAQPFASLNAALFTDGLVLSLDPGVALEKPVQMQFDAKGRLWVAVWPSYPHWKPTEERNDKILIFEDTKGTGKADKKTVFADHLSCPTGFEFYNGGVLVAQAPDIMFLKDSTGGDHADTRVRVLSGMESAATHHTSNSFALHPGGAVYWHD